MKQSNKLGETICQAQQFILSEIILKTEGKTVFVMKKTELLDHKPTFEVIH